MKHPMSALSKISLFTLALLGSAACADTDRPQASQPSNTVAQTAPISPQDNPGVAGRTDMSPSSSGTMATTTSPSTNPAPSTPNDAIGSTNAQGGSTMAQGGSPITTGQSPPATTGNTGGGTLAVASTLADPQIAAVVIAVNQGEIQEAQLAESRAKSLEVRAFAAQMIQAHQGMLIKSRGDFTSAHLIPTENVVSQELATDAQSEISTLQSTTARDFDRQYIDDQIKAHTLALDLIDHLLMAAKSPQLRAGLVDARATVGNHLADAKAVQQKLFR